MIKIPLRCVEDRPTHHKGILIIYIQFNIFWPRPKLSIVGYRREELNLSFHLAMGTASEASTSLQGVACNMAILAGATGCKRPKSRLHGAYKQPIFPISDLNKQPDNTNTRQ